MLFVLAGLSTAGAATPAQAAASLGECLQATAATLDPRAVAALEQVPDPGRRLLALRAYLRSGTGLAARWSWTRAEIDAWQGSPAQRSFEAQIERVRVAFAERHPGHSLEVNPQVRSLEVQLAHWNENASVGAAGEGLQLATQDWLAGNACPPPGEFARFLRAQVPDPTPTLAAPGLSLHGQMRAIDFHVYRGAQPVAEPEYARVAKDWDAGGWREHLKAAVLASGVPLAGPLQRPDEPWHYEYRGSLQAGAAESASLPAVAAP